ncbi:RNase-H domain containing protein [Pyrenophora tritici-repentis]|nr:RNase-H domain-containing protein [Pyrenophora tritici-repentis]KAI1562802.1 RNase-H domain containing protein [Pyrenophora tritici-repentis]PZC89714.1 RNase-H domain containing protein [Pyrenophora tritici-repentis]PZD29245.1 RNase-H domain containing protein [Pyrenophora tritici-repentis]
MASLLRDPGIYDFDIIAIQEPWKNPYATTTHHPAKNKFHLCYPTSHIGGIARVCFFINKKIDQLRWRFEERTRDICSIIIDPKDDQQQQERLVIHNVYNPPKTSSNRQSVLPQVADLESEDLIDIIGDCALHNTLSPGTTTYEEGRSQSTIDLCLVTTGLIDKVIKSEVDRGLDHNSDHLPISTTLDLTVQQLKKEPRKDWKRLDEKEYTKALRHALPPLRRPLTKAALDAYTGEVTAAIQNAIHKAVPETQPSTYTREGWTEECRAILAETKRLKRVHSQYHTEETWEAYRAARNQKARTISKALRKAHRNRIEQATESPDALWKLASSTWGVRLQDMRRLYEAIALPQMMYACSIWSNANLNDKNRAYTHKTIDALRSIQARAARSICGAYRATSRAALDVETFLLPIEQQIWKHNADVVTRLSSSRDIAKTAGFELREPAPVAMDKNYRAHKSPWQKIYEALRSKQVRNLDKQEHIPPFITPPWQRGPHTHIEGNADKARDRHDAECAADNSLSIYTDGSGIDGEIGSAAVCPLTQQTLSAHMGPSTLSTVYAAELQGISLALQIARRYENEHGERKSIAIYTDNQAAIWSIAKAEGRSGAYILGEIAQQVQELQDKGLTVTVRWIPAHVGIPGNEAADQAAKEATGWREDGRSQLPANPPSQLYPLKTTLRRWCKTQAERAWISAWREDKRGRATYRHTPTPTKKVLQLHERLSKRESALLVQLRTEKIGLNDFLFSRHVPTITNPRCSCGERRQTVAHVLLRCSKYKDLRNRIFANLSGRNSLRTILSTPQLATKAIEYMEQTQILGQVGIRDE